jgi:phospholipid-binding lipoprotein MlaA
VKPRAVIVCAALLLPLVVAAADEPLPGAEPRPAHPADPLEPWNRGVFSFNEGLDKAVLKPVANGYRKVVPEPIRRAVGNFFGNFGDAWSAANHFLQGKPVTGLQMTMRFATNTALGFGGLLDIGTEVGLERQEEDFGQTLGRWGLPAGPYLVWPLFGPSSLRETAAMPLDRGWSASIAFSDSAERFGLASLNLVDTRARLLGASQMLDDIALDKYSFVRDAYLARRRSLVYDGEPPDTPEDKDDEPVDKPDTPPAR